MNMDSSDHARELLDHGYSVFEGAWSQQEVELLRALILERFHEEKHLPKQLWSDRDYKISDSISMAYTGVVIYSMVRDRPQVGELLLKPIVVDALRGVLGDAMAIEIVGAVVTDETRPFFAWHTHIGGLTMAITRAPARGRRSTRPIASPRSCTSTTSTTTAGSCSCIPQSGRSDPAADEPERRALGRAGRASREKGDVGRDGAVHLAHRATDAAKRLAGVSGCTFRAGHVKAPEWTDTSLRKSAHLSPLLASVLPSQ